MSHPVGGREYYKDAKLLTTLKAGNLNVNVPDTPFKALFLRKKANGSIDQIRLHNAANGGGDILYTGHNTGTTGLSGQSDIIPFGLLNGSNVKSISFATAGGAAEVEVYELF